VNFEYVAQTQSSHSVNIQARVAGFLDKRVYTEGEFVKLGQVLFEMDKKPFQAQLNAAQAALAQQEAALANARSNLARVKPLTALNALSQKDLDDAESSFQTTSASVEQAKAQLETAQLNLSYCTISSPLDGITSAARQQEGAYLDLSSSLLTTVSALTPMWVNFSLSENQLQSFNDQITRGSLLMPPDEKYIVHIIQTNGELFPYKGTITFKEPQFNPQTGTFLTRVNVDNPQGVLRPNQYVRVRIEGAVRPHAILIPQRAVQESAKGHYVWVVNEQKKAELRPVEVGDWQGENWFIADGLKSGEQVVLDGGMTLHAGDLVEIVSKDVQPLNNK
jgi:membrane fusion protein (multidrug efflux system)